MNTLLRNVIKEESEEAHNSPGLPPGVCTSPGLDELLPDYIADLLAESIAEEVEDHLLDCLHCRTKHLAVVGISDALRKSPAHFKRSSGGAKILNMPSSRKSEP